MRQVEEPGSFDETGELRQIENRLETLRKDEAVLTGYELDLVRFEIAYLQRQQARLGRPPAPATVTAVPSEAPPEDDFWAGWDAD